MRSDHGNVVSLSPRTFIAMDALFGSHVRGTAGACDGEPVSDKLLDDLFLRQDKDR